MGRGYPPERAEFVQRFVRRGRRLSSVGEFEAVRGCREWLLSRYVQKGIADGSESD